MNENEEVIYEEENNNEEEHNNEDEKNSESGKKKNSPPTSVKGLKEKIKNKKEEVKANVKTAMKTGAKKGGLALVKGIFSLIIFIISNFVFLVILFVILYLLLVIISFFAITGVGESTPIKSEPTGPQTVYDSIGDFFLQFYNVDPKVIKERFYLSFQGEKAIVLPQSSINYTLFGYDCNFEYKDVEGFERNICYYLDKDFREVKLDLKKGVQDTIKNIYPTPLLKLFNPVMIGQASIGKNSIKEYSNMQRMLNKHNIKNIIKIPNLKVGSKVLEFFHQSKAIPVLPSQLKVYQWNGPKTEVWDDTDGENEPITTFFGTRKHEYFMLNQKITPGLYFTDESKKLKNIQKPKNFMGYNHNGFDTLCEFNGGFPMPFYKGGYYLGTYQHYDYNTESLVISKKGSPIIFYTYKQDDLFDLGKKELSNLLTGSKKSCKKITKAIFENYSTELISAKEKEVIKEESVLSNSTPFFNKKMTERGMNNTCGIGPAKKRLQLIFEKILEENRENYSIKILGLYSKIYNLHLNIDELPDNTNINDLITVIIKNDRGTFDKKIIKEAFKDYVETGSLELFKNDNVRKNQIIYQLLKDDYVLLKGPKIKNNNTNNQQKIFMNLFASYLHVSGGNNHFQSHLKKYIMGKYENYMENKIGLKNSFFNNVIKLPDNLEKFKILSNNENIKKIFKNTSLLNLGDNNINNGNNNSLVGEGYVNMDTDNGLFIDPNIVNTEIKKYNIGQNSKEIRNIFEKVNNFALSFTQYIPSGFTLFSNLNKNNKYIGRMEDNTGFSYSTAFPYAQYGEIFSHCGSMGYSEGKHLHFTFFPFFNTEEELSVSDLKKIEEKTFGNIYEERLENILNKEVKEIFGKEFEEKKSVFLSEMEEIAKGLEQLNSSITKLIESIENYNYNISINQNKEVIDKSIQKIKDNYSTYLLVHSQTEKFLKQDKIDKKIKNIIKLKDNVLKKYKDTSFIDYNKMYFGVGNSCDIDAEKNDTKSCDKEEYGNLDVLISGDTLTSYRLPLKNNLYKNNSLGNNVVTSLLQNKEKKEAIILSYGKSPIRNLKQIIGTENARSNWIYGKNKNIGNQKILTKLQKLIIKTQAQEYINKLGGYTIVDRSLPIMYNKFYTESTYTKPQGYIEVFNKDDIFKDNVKMFLYNPKLLHRYQGLVSRVLEKGCTHNKPYFNHLLKDGYTTSDLLAGIGNSRTFNQESVCWKLGDDIPYYQRLIIPYIFLQNDGLELGGFFYSTPNNMSGYHTGLSIFPFLYYYGTEIKGVNNKISGLGRTMIKHSSSVKDYDFSKIVKKALFLLQSGKDKDIKLTDENTNNFLLNILGPFSDNLFTLGRLTNHNYVKGGRIVSLGGYVDPNTSFTSNLTLYLDIIKASDFTSFGEGYSTIDTKEDVKEKLKEKMNRYKDNKKYVNIDQKKVLKNFDNIYKCLDNKEIINSKSNTTFLTSIGGFIQQYGLPNTIETYNGLVNHIVNKNSYISDIVHFLQNDDTKQIYTNFYNFDIPIVYKKGTDNNAIVSLKSVKFSQLKEKDGFIGTLSSWVSGDYKLLPNIATVNYINESNAQVSENIEQECYNYSDLLVDDRSGENIKTKIKKCGYVEGKILNLEKFKENINKTRSVNLDGQLLDTLCRYNYKKDGFDGHPTVVKLQSLCFSAGKHYETFFLPQNEIDISTEGGYNLIGDGNIQDPFFSSEFRNKFNQVKGSWSWFGTGINDIEYIRQLYMDAAKRIKEYYSPISESAGKGKIELNPFNFMLFYTHMLKESGFNTVNPYNGGYGGWMRCRDYNFKQKISVNECKERMMNNKGIGIMSKVYLDHPQYFTMKVKNGNQISKGVVNKGAITNYLGWANFWDNSDPNNIPFENLGIKNMFTEYNINALGMFSISQMKGGSFLQKTSAQYRYIKNKYGITTDEFGTYPDGTRKFLLPEILLLWSIWNNKAPGYLRQDFTRDYENYLNGGKLFSPSNTLCPLNFWFCKSMSGYYGSQDPEETYYVEANRWARQGLQEYILNGGNLSFSGTNNKHNILFTYALNKSFVDGSSNNNYNCANDVKDIVRTTIGDLSKEYDELKNPQFILDHLKERSEIYSNEEYNNTVSSEEGLSKTELLIKRKNEYQTKKIEKGTKISQYDIGTDNSITKYIGKGYSFNNLTYEPTNLLPVLDSNSLEVFKKTEHGKDKKPIKQQLRKEALEKLNLMANQYFNDTNKKLPIFATYRSHWYQKNKVSNTCKYIDYECPVEGEADYQSGLAIDFGYDKDSLKKFKWTSGILGGNKKLYQWLKSNAHKYGFNEVYQYGKEIDGFDEQPWHWRYVGIDLADYLYKNNLSFNKFIAENI